MRASRRLSENPVRDSGVQGPVVTFAMVHLSGTDRSQLLLLPEAVDDFVEPDNPVRFIEAFVDGLDLAAAGFVRVAAKGTGVWAARLHERDRQSLPQCAGRKLHEDLEGRGRLCGWLRQLCRRSRTIAEIHRRCLQLEDCIQPLAIEHQRNLKSNSPRRRLSLAAAPGPAPGVHSTSGSTQGLFSAPPSAIDNSFPQTPRNLQQTYYHRAGADTVMVQL